MLEVVGGILFWSGLFGILHTYIFYPLSLLLFARRSPPAPDEPTDWPKISILVAAYNEEACIAAKIENSLALDYPSEKLEILVGSDCSTDHTVEIVKGSADPRVRLFEMDQRTGKVGVLNRLANEAGGDIFIFSDAGAHIHAGALRKLIRHFSDPSVCVVSGRMDMIPPKAAKEVRGDNLYRKYEIFLKILESNLGGTSGAYGGLYAVRREIFAPFHFDGRLDDMVQQLHAIEQGKRAIFEPIALCFSETGASLRKEFRRHVRIAVGSFQTLAKLGYMMHPRFGATAYIFFSHKTLRWISPFLLLAILIGSFLLQHILFYKIVLWLQILLYGIAVLGGLLNTLQISLPGITLIYHFIILNVALLVGFLNWLRGSRPIIWERTGRGPASKNP